MYKLVISVILALHGVCILLDGLHVARYWVEMLGSCRGAWRVIVDMDWVILRFLVYLYSVHSMYA